MVSQHVYEGLLKTRQLQGGTEAQKLFHVLCLVLLGPDLKQMFLTWPWAFAVQKNSFSTMKAAFHTQVELANSQTICMVRIYTVIIFWEEKNLCGLSVSFDLCGQSLDRHFLVKPHLGLTFIFFLQKTEDNEDNNSSLMSPCSGMVMSFIGKPTNPASQGHSRRKNTAGQNTKVNSGIAVRSYCYKIETGYIYHSNFSPAAANLVGKRICAQDLTPILFSFQGFPSVQ